MDTVLPASSVIRVIKDSGMLPTGWHINREAKTSLSRAGAIFAVYLSSTANDICHESRRSTISATDVMRALEDVDLAEFVQLLQQDLQGEKRSRGWELAGDHY
jgi:DNA polymerase epsilon subunit 3